MSKASRERETLKNKKSHREEKIIKVTNDEFSKQVMSQLISVINKSWTKDITNSDIVSIFKKTVIRNIKESNKGELFKPLKRLTDDEIGFLAVIEAEKLNISLLK